jgi:hypothetical protein
MIPPQMFVQSHHVSDRMETTKTSWWSRHVSRVVIYYVSLMLTYVTEPATGQTYTGRYRTAKEETRALHNPKQSFHRASKESRGSSVSIVTGWVTDDSDFVTGREPITFLATVLRSTLRSCETQICMFIVYLTMLSVVRPPLWSSGQSSWLQNGYVLCFLWDTNWIYMLCRKK